MQKIINWLNQPYPYEGTIRESVKSALIAGLFVFLFLVVFKPFGLRAPATDYWRFLLVCSYFGLVTAGSLLLISVGMSALPSYFKEEKWVVGKEIVTNVVIVLLIGTGNMLLASFVFKQPLTLPVFLTWQKITISIGIFPILFTAYTKQQRLQRRHTTGANELNTRIADHPPQATIAPPTLTLEGDNQNETLSLPPSSILYLEAADNYVQVYFEKNGNVDSSMLRSTLKKMENQLGAYPQFFRCHRTYIVNLNHVNRVSGNAQGYKLHLENSVSLIPVSRSLNEEIVERFK